MTQKTKNQLKWIPSILITLIVVSGSLMKLAGVSQLKEHYAAMGLLQAMPFFAAAELFLIVLFLVPRTLKTGLFLLTGYFGGAMGVELTQQGLFILPAVILSVLWTAAVIRSREVLQLVLPAGDCPRHNKLKTLQIPE